MRKMFLCTLAVLGLMNFAFGQSNSNTGKISVKTYDTKGLVEQFHVEGNAALSFDISTYIKENNHVERLIINGLISTDASITMIKFDSNDQQHQDGDDICKEVQTSLKPFIGTEISGRDDLNGVDIDRIIHAAPAAIAGITTSESITEFNGEIINSTCDLKSAVKSSNIGDKVELILNAGSQQYSKYVTIGSREVNVVTYKYCEEKSLQENSLDVDTEEISLTSYPNPTRSTSHVNFKSTSNEDIIFSVMDIRGNIIHKETRSDFNGNLRLDYNHQNESAGTYIIVIQQGKEMYKHLVQLVK